MRKLFEDVGVLSIEASSFIDPLRERYGDDIRNVYEIYSKDIGARLIEESYGEQLEHAVVVGLRTVEEYEYFRARYQVKLIHLQASLSTCYTRSCARLNREKYDCIDEFYQRRIALDNMLGLDNLLAQAHDTLWNEGQSVDMFFRHAFELINPLLSAEN